GPAQNEQGHCSPPCAGPRQSHIKMKGPSIPSSPSSPFPLELEPYPQSYLTLAAAEVARVVANRERATERDAGHVVIWVAPPRLVEQLDGRAAAFRSPLDSTAAACAA